MLRVRAVVVVLAALFSAGPLSAGWMQGNDWERYRSALFGYSLLFPADVFKLQGESPNGQGQEFISGDGRAKLKVFAVHNMEGIGLDQYRATIMRDFSGRDKVEYGPMGQSWFVLSGVHGGSIYYQKVMFSCGGRVINAFALTYPREQKRTYDGIVTGIEKSFRPASGATCYAADR